MSNEQIIAVSGIFAVVLAYLALAFSAHFWPFSKSATECVFAYQQTTTCSSTDPTVQVNFVNQENDPGCTFDAQVNWGDGSPLQNVSVPGGAPGAVFLAQHEYSGAGEYSIAVDGSSSAGCPVSFGRASFSFTDS
jgi:hypothetical protein